MITRDNIKELQKETDAGFLECQIALKKTNGNINEAIRLIHDNRIKSLYEKNSLEFKDKELNNLFNESKYILESLNKNFENIETKANEHINELFIMYKNLYNNDYKILEEKYNLLEIEYKKIKDNNLSTYKNYGKIKALNIFNSINEFLNYTKDLYDVEKWIIKPGDYKERAQRIESKDYYIKIKNLFNEKNLIDKHIACTQLITYFDTMHLMYKLLSKFNNELLKNELKIIQEYKIGTIENERPDYVLVFRNTIILLEFSKCDIGKNKNKTSNEKMNQLNNYENYLKQTLKDYSKINIYKYAIIYNSEDIKEDIFKNDECISEKYRFIINDLEKDVNAFELLIDTK